MIWLQFVVWKYCLWVTPIYRFFWNKSQNSLHNGNTFTSLPFKHSGHLEENLLSMILGKMKYQEHRWEVCRDFKMITILVISRQITQNILASYACDDLHCTKTNWSLWGSSPPREENVINTTLVSREKILLSPHHINLCSSLLNKKCFKYVCFQFPKLAEERAVTKGPLY